MQEQGTRLAPEYADEHMRDDAGADRRTYTLTEAAERLGISRGLAYEAASRGELPVCRIGRRILVPRAALARLLGESSPSIRPT
jgi:excisionase family DNA binding protein